MDSDTAVESSALSASLTAAAIDQLLAAQLIIAWAGEKGGEDERRLGWWRSDLVSEFGGQDLFERLLPHTWQWFTPKGGSVCVATPDRMIQKPLALDGRDCSAKAFPALGT